MLLRLVCNDLGLRKLHFVATLLFLKFLGFHLRVVPLLEFDKHRCDGWLTMSTDTSTLIRTSSEAPTIDFFDFKLAI